MLHGIKGVKKFSLACGVEDCPVKRYLPMAAKLIRSCMHCRTGVEAVVGQCDEYGTSPSLIIA